MSRPLFKHHVLRHLKLKETWIVFFILGIIMMNYPFISIFNKEVFLSEMPLLYIYLQGGWFVSILVIYLFTHAIRETKEEDGEERN